MRTRLLGIFLLVCGPGLFAAGRAMAADPNDKREGKRPAKVYVPYKQLKGLFEKEGQGVFLPYKDFEKLWRAAQDKPAGVTEAPFEYLISTARFTGDVKAELATLRLELTIDVLADGWVQVPLGLGEVAVSEAALLETESARAVPLLRVANGQYIFVTKGKGRYVLALDFVRQLETRPGLQVLKYRIPSAAVTTLELVIPEENLKVDVEPMLAATTSQVKVDDASVTKLQAFLGSAKEVSLSWKPRTEAAVGLEAVVVCEQFHHIDVSEALVSHVVKLDYGIHRGGADSFDIRLPGNFRVTDVSGSNIAKWDIEQADGGPGPGGQMLKVTLFSAAKDKYSLTIKMERFLQESQVRIALSPVTTGRVLRRSGLIGITYSPRRSVHLEDTQNLARVDTGQLPAEIRKRPGVTAYRFIASDYAGTIAIETASPRIMVDQRWVLGVEGDRLALRGRTRYKVERTGVFELSMNLPEPWKVESVGPDTLVDDYQFKGEGDARVLHVLLKKENLGQFDLNIAAGAERIEAEGDVDFILPLVDANNVQSYRGQFMLLLADHLRAEVEQVRQLQSIPLGRAESWTKIAGLSAVMAFEFRALDRSAPAGATLKIAIKPVQISATVHRLVNIQASSVAHEAVVQYRIRYAPVDTLYLKMPASLADLDPEITDKNNNIKERPRIDELPPDQIADAAGPQDANWAYYKIVLQSKVTGSYELKVSTYQPFEAGQSGEPAVVKVEPILAAGRLSDQNGHIAIVKADTLAVAEPVMENLIPADAGSPADLPYQPHRRIASLAFKYNAPPFELSLPVVTQKEATVFTTIVSGAIVEQVLARDGMLNTHATYLLATSQGDRIPIKLPKGAELTALLLNGSEAPVEMGLSAEERIVRLPPSAGQVSKFVLEISYGLRKARASALRAPALPEQIPVQQTLWRLWAPKEWYFLGHSRLFSRLEPGQSQNMLRTLAGQHGGQVAFKLPGQGRPLDFLRQGAPGRLSVRLAGKGAFNILIWVLIIAACVLMLKQSGSERIRVILIAAFAGGVIHLYSPLFARQFAISGVFAAVLVLLLWAGDWAFKNMPELRVVLEARRQKKDRQQEDEKVNTGKTKAPDGKKQGRSKKDQE